jgi:tRNA-splicing ligase RtcB
MAKRDAQATRNRMVLAKEGDMRVDVTVYGSPAILDGIEPEALQQLRNAACLPGVVGVAGMPDIHTGYGLPIGGVMAVDARDPAGVVSPGAVGVDINCGVRAVTTPLTAEEVAPRLKSLFKDILTVVGTGVGGKSRSEIGRVTGEDFRRLVEKGVPWVVKQGYGTAADVQHTEDHGVLEPASMDDVSAKARDRGAGQVGTLGSGNHFLEVQRVAQVYEEQLANGMGLFADQVVVMIHCGSRGFGEQTCQDYLRVMEGAMARYGIHPPTRHLAAAPMDSDEGRAYLRAMACAANYAWVNRQVIMHEVRGAFQRVFGLRYDDLRLVYDVAHNIAKLEEHGGRPLLIHRKGATRAFPAGHALIPPDYRAIGQPAVIPGSMGTASFIVVGTDVAMRETYGSVNHGSGRLMSRSAAVGKKGRGGRVTDEEFRTAMRGILYMSGSGENLLDEAPQVYKDSLAVVDSLADIGLVTKVARLMPMAVLKG